MCVCVRERERERENSIKDIGDCRERLTGVNKFGVVVGVG